MRMCMFVFVCVCLSVYIVPRRCTVFWWYMCCQSNAYFGRMCISYFSFFMFVYTSVYTVPTAGMSCLLVGYIFSNNTLLGRTCHVHACICFCLNVCVSVMAGPSCSTVPGGGNVLSRSPIIWQDVHVCVLACMFVCQRAHAISCKSVLVFVSTCRV